MEEKTAIALILSKLNNDNIPSVVGLGEHGLGRIKDILLRDANKAISEYLKSRDPGPLVEIISSMYAYGRLKDDEYEKLLLTFQENK